MAFRPCGSRRMKWDERNSASVRERPPIVASTVGRYEGVVALGAVIRAMEYSKVDMCIT